MFYLQQEIFIKTKRGRAYDKVHEKKKLAHKCIICNEKFLSKQSVEEHNMSVHEEKSLPTHLLFPKKNSHKKRGRTYYLGS